MCLFGVNTSGAVNGAQLGALRMYSCSIYDNDILVRYYIPCTNASGIAGLYDTVSGVFFRDAASGSAEPVDLPTGYTQVEYIQSSGTQYVNTGYMPSGKSRLTMDCALMDASIASCFYCARSVASSAAADTNTMFLTVDGVYRCDYYGGTSHTGDSYGSGERFTIDNDKGTISIGQYNIKFSQSSVRSKMTWLLMASASGTGANISGFNYFAKMRLYSCVIYDNEKLVRHYVPCTDAMGKVGLYDTVSSSFFSNAGSGTFSAGAEVSSGFEPGMPVPEPTPPDENVWQIGDVVKQSEWAQYLANVQSLRDAYYTMPDSPELPEPTAPLAYDGANAIEKLLYDVSQLYDAMVASYRLCGAFKCGSNAQHLPLQRSVI